MGGLRTGSTVLNQRSPAGLALPFEQWSSWSLLKESDNESRNDGSKAGACAVHARVQVGGGAAGEPRSGHCCGGQGLGHPQAGLRYRVRQAAKWALSGAGSEGEDEGKAERVSPEQMESAPLRAEVAPFRMECDIAKRAAAHFVQDSLRWTPGFTKCDGSTR